MKVLLGCDVDPILPPILREPPRNDIWECLTNLERLVDEVPELPPVTWLLRADESVRFCTGAFDSAFQLRASFWELLKQDGHELGWHMHLGSFDRQANCFVFEPEPVWLSDAHASLQVHYEVKATRTGWDFCSNTLMRALNDLGILLDFSALPGNVAWFNVGPDRLKVDWSRCPLEPYHPAGGDYQRKGELGILEVPITQFRQSVIGGVKRFLWRTSHGCPQLTGLRNKTQKLTDFWAALPDSATPIMAFYFHPEDVDRGQGLANLTRNLQLLRSMPDVEFATASSILDDFGLQQDEAEAIRHGRPREPE